MAKKAPRRTAQRILSTTLALFNRFGEPNVSTTLISSELSISPGNLYYHFPAKDELVTALFEEYQAKLFPILAAGAHVSDVELGFSCTPFLNSSGSTVFSTVILATC